MNHALSTGHEVVALRRSAESMPRIVLARKPAWLTMSMGQITERDLAGMDVVVHLAAAGISPRSSTWNELLEWNVVVPTKLLLTAASAGVRRFVVAGSCLEYGRAGGRYEFIPPDAPLEPTGAYAASKAAGSVLFCTIAAEQKLQLSYLRLFSVFGVGQHEGNLWPMICRAALAGENLALTPGEQVRDFVAVEHVAAELLTAARDETVVPGVPRVRNVGTGRPQTVRQFAEHWWREFRAQGKLLVGELPYRGDEVMRYVPQV
ncbi:MAG: NAD-dependent epimerase/dehydratase family protein [Planctomycetes bacterium]|nr:NAD-dependent epimerase/dehydratase family protein [Planctomycetota bacterium]